VVSVTPRPRFSPEERTPGTHCTGGWVGPRAGLDTRARKKLFRLCRGSTSLVQSVVRHCSSIGCCYTVRELDAGTYQFSVPVYYYARRAVQTPVKQDISPEPLFFTVSFILLCSSPESRRMRWARHVARMGEERKMVKVL
jgi:hypothetical protein